MNTRRGRPPYPDILTPRQFEVLELVREGLSNGEIGRRLGISSDGAKFHVSEIITKLGVTTRREAAGTEAAPRPSARLRLGARRTVAGRKSHVACRRHHDRLVLASRATPLGQPPAVAHASRERAA